MFASIHSVIKGGKALNVAVISTCLYAEELEDKINKRWKQITFPIFISTCKTKKQGQMTCFYYEIKDTLFLRFYSRFLGKKIRLRICTLIFNMIQENIQYELLREMIDKEYSTLPIIERNHFFENVKQWLALPSAGIDREQEKKVKNILFNELLDFLEENKEIHLEGFIQFRMQQYKTYLRQLMEVYLQQWQVQQEYNHFIELLQMFLSTQPSQMEILHVVAHKDGTLTIVDDNGKDITDWSIQEFIKELDIQEWSYEDILMSAVIQLAPTKVIIHKHEYIKNQKVMNTLKRLFSANLNFCSQCSRCTEEFSGYKNRG